MPFFEIATRIPPRLVVEADRNREALQFVRSLFAKFEPIFDPSGWKDRLLCSGCETVLYDHHTAEVADGRWLLLFDSSGNFKWLCEECVAKRGILQEIHERHHAYEDPDPHEIAQDPDGVGGGPGGEGIG